MIRRVVYVSKGGQKQVWVFGNWAGREHDVPPGAFENSPSEADAPHIGARSGPEPLGLLFSFFLEVYEDGRASFACVNASQVPCSLSIRITFDPVALPSIRGHVGSSRI